MQVLFIFLCIIVFIAVLIAFALTGALNEKRRYPYRQRERLFTPAEWRFFAALRQAVPEGTIIFGKVRVADVLQPEAGLDRSTWQTAFNKTAGKHFDFILCDTATGRMRCGIELNDRSHDRRDRQERDTFLAGACRNADFPLLMVTAAREYDVASLREEIERCITGKSLAQPERAALPSSPFPEAGLNCPQCGSPLVERNAKRGQRAGQVFLSCADFPRCRYGRAR